MHFRFAAVAMLFAAFLTFDASAMEISKYPRVYKGGEGLVVKVVSLKSEKKQALVEISGIDTELDGIVLLTEEVIQGKGSALQYRLHGEDRFIIRSDETWYGWKSMEVYLPETPTKSVGVYYDEKESKKVKGEALLRRYEKTKKDGTLAKLEKFNRADREKQQNKYYAEEAAHTEKACGIKLPAAIDWKTVTDDMMKDISIYGYCQAPLDALRWICDKGPEKKAAVQKKVKKVGCRFGTAMKITVSGDGLVAWTTYKDAANASDFAQANLENALQ